MARQEQALIRKNIAFMDRILTERVVTFATLQAFAKKQKAALKLNIKWAA